MKKDDGQANGEKQQDSESSKATALKKKTRSLLPIGVLAACLVVVFLSYDDKEIKLKFLEAAAFASLVMTTVKVLNREGGDL